MRFKQGILIVIVSVIALAGSYKVFYAASTDNLSGWAWSSTIGWISFNNITDGSSKNYGVKIESDDNLSGYAWSENIGWVSFNPADTSSCGAQAKLVGTSFEGWARALAYGYGWDGCISLKGLAQDGASYGIVLDSSSLKSFAWGDAVVGWLQFNPSLSGVFYNNTGQMNIRRIDSTGADLGGTTAYLDSGVQSTANPAIFTKVASGVPHTAGVGQDARSLVAAQCTYTVGQPECSATNFNLTPTCDTAAKICTVPATVSAGMVTKTVFKYTNVVGDVVVKRIGTSDDWTTAPEGTVASLDGVALSTNPAIYTNISAGSHTITSTNKDGWSVKVGSCTYPIPAGGTLNASDVPPTGCTVSTFTPVTSGATPSYTGTVLAGKVLKVVFQYTSNSSADTPPPETVACRPEDPLNPGVRIAEAPVGQPVRWVSIGANGADYIWKEGSTIIGQGSGLSSITKVYTSKGPKSVSLTIGSNTALCDMVGTQQSFKTTANPYYREF